MFSEHLKILPDKIWYAVGTNLQNWGILVILKVNYVIRQQQNIWMETE